MVCPECGGSCSVRVLLRYPYEECGLGDVILLNVKAHSCDDCGAVMACLGNAEKLTSLIVRELFKKEGPLTEDEALLVMKWQRYSSDSRDTETAVKGTVTAIPLHIEIDVQDDDYRVLTTR